MLIDILAVARYEGNGGRSMSIFDKARSDEVANIDQFIFCFDGVLECCMAPERGRRRIKETRRSEVTKVKMPARSKQ